MNQQTYRALIVDNDAGVRETTARAMVAESFSCDTACDGQEGLEKYRQGRHDLVVTDLRMPRMHGYALTLELLKNEPPPRIVVLTDVVEPSLVKDLYRRGVDDVIHKPIDVRAFAVKMAALFARPGWRESLLAAQRDARPKSAGHMLVAEIEHALSARSEPATPELEALFAAAAASAPDPPQAMVNYLERASDDDEGERRRWARASLLATVTAIPLTGDLQPCGEPFKAAARDASAGGISLLHTRAVTAECLALRWRSLAAPAAPISLLLRVQRCQPMGPFYEVAGNFLPRTAGLCETELSQDFPT
jgi:DNA-binding response OmpR family regulator